MTGEPPSHVPVMKQTGWISQVSSLAQIQRGPSGLVHFLLHNMLPTNQTRLKLLSWWILRRWSRKRKRSFLQY
ncbi:hypothetical protein INR49_006699 [Caranx melampygus]|nr:hypothetical protein INR49_006699 [Caranx melampygus]